MHPLNVAEIFIGTKALGPGNRSVVWLQGCPFRCKSCYSPDWIQDIPNQLLPSDLLASILIEDRSIDGVTISGGEPFHQPDGLFDLLSNLRKEKPEVSIIVFTGYRLEQLEARTNWLGMDQFKPLVDVLIDGLYIESLDDGIGLRGSVNQQFHYFSERHRLDHLETQPRVNEIKVYRDAIQLVGIPTRALSKMVLSESFRKV